MFNNSKIKISEYDIKSEKTLSGFTIAHVSDMHEKEFGKGNARLFEAVRSIEPDIIAITGDIVAHEKQKRHEREYTKDLAHGLADIAPSYFVAGNHERHFYEEVCAVLERGGVRIISEGNVFHTRAGGTDVNISGMDDISFDGVDALRASAALSAAVGFNIFLSHRPEVFPVLVGKNIDMVLAGHTHAGQIRIPGISNLYMPGQGFFPKYMQGEFSAEGTAMIISRGLGSSGYPTFRINNPPDLVAVRVQPGKAEYGGRSAENGGD